MLVLLILLLILPVAPAHADGTTVSGDQSNSAIIIDGEKSGTHKDPHKPCLEYVMAQRSEVLLPGDSLIAIPCRGSGVAEVSRALKERVIRYLPPLRPAMAPARDALVHVPQVFWSNQHPVSFSVMVLGRAVTVNAIPQFHWTFGDGQSLATSRSGRPYPNLDVTHRYNRPCRCSITTVTSWSVEWSDGGEWHPLSSVLTQRANLILEVRRAPIRLTE